MHDGLELTLSYVLTTDIKMDDEFVVVSFAARKGLVGHVDACSSSSCILNTVGSLCLELITHRLQKESQQRQRTMGTADALLIGR